MRDYKLDPDSSNLWQLQLTLDKKGLSAFELRPQNELQTDARIGLFSDAQAADYQDELDEWLENRRGLSPDKWWEKQQPSPDARQAPLLRAERHGHQHYRLRFRLRGLDLPDLQHLQRVHFVAGRHRLHHPRPRLDEQGQPLSPGQAQLLDARRGPQINVIRFQGRRDDAPFRAGTGELVKTKDRKIVMREVYENYNVR